MPLKPLGQTTAPKPKTKKPIYNPSLALQGTPEGKRYLARIRKLSPYERLIYWITERHSIHCKRYGMHSSKGIGLPHWKDGMPHTDAYTDRKQNLPPWTDDPILQTIFFCNPYRENDKVTGYLRDNFREEYRDNPCVFLGTILLRMFNHIPTMRRLLNANIPQRLCTSPKEAGKALSDMQKLLVPLRDAGEQIFGGAYIIIFPPGERKVERAYQTMMGLVKERKNLLDCMASMEGAFNALVQQYGIGQFYTYQYIGDLAYTHVLENAPDWQTWGYCGPGTARGLYRLQGITEINGVPLERRCPMPVGAMDQLALLQKEVNRDLKKAKLPTVHMRDLTNSLCEYDKYERAMNNERHVKRPYAGT